MVLPTSRENSTHSYFWKRFLSAVCILIFALFYLQHKAFSRDEILAWVVSLFAFVFLIVLSPLQTLFFSHPRRAPVMYSIDILHDPKAQRDPKERHLEWVFTLIIHSFLTSLYSSSPILIKNSQQSIVAIHGLGSSPNRAWVHKDTGKCWLKDFLPKALPNARIIAFNHDSSWSSHAPRQSLSEYSEALLEEYAKLHDGEMADKLPVIFIAHSFGGILLKKARYYRFKHLNHFTNRNSSRPSLLHNLKILALSSIL